MPLTSTVTCTEKTNTSPLRISGDAGKRLKVGKAEELEMMVALEIDINSAVFSPSSLE